MAKEKRYIIKDREQSSLAESFRVLRSSIQDAQNEGELKTILFTGASLGEGSAMTAINTAVAMAYAGMRTVLLDCDFRDPIVHDVFGLKNQGVVNIIRDNESLVDLLQESGIDKLQVLASGSIVGRSVELLSNTKLRDIIKELKMVADYIIINSSPLQVKADYVVSDACILAGKVDGVVLVIDSRKVRVTVAKRVSELLNATKARIIGTVLNDVRDDEQFRYDMPV